MEREPITVKKMKKICKRCLLYEYDEQAYRDKLERLISLMEESEKAEEALYQERLKRCKSCEKLVTGTCLVCGCYVELRAAAKGGRCPNHCW